jgi:uncharacterized protein YjeT (DUF2065 family)
MILEFIKEHKMAVVTVIYSIISLYVLFSQTPKSFEKYSLITNILLLFGLFIMLMYTLIPQATTASWVYITLAIIAATGAFYGMFNVPMISDTLTLLFNLAIFGGAAYLVYKYVIQRFLNIQLPANISMPHITMNPIATAIFLSLIVVGIVKWLYPKAERKMEGGGMLVLDDPVHLNTLRSIGDYQELNKSDDTHNYHYSVSFWSFIHSQPHKSKKYTPIFNYGRKPIVEYNGATEKVRIRVADKTIYEGKIAPQRWTNFVVTYDRGIVDVFIDAKLVATEKGVVPYMTYDTMTVGENNGVSGGIGYVRYYDTPIRKDTIDYNYKKFRSSTFF